MNDWIWIVVAVVFMLPGLLGIILPLLPGLPYMFVVALVYAFLEGFQSLTGKELLILLMIALVSLIIDYASGILGARFGGASKRAIGYGFIGLLAGLFIFPPFGGIIGLFVGVLLAELQQSRTKDQALKAATGSLLGAVSGMVLNLALGIAFIITFIIFAK